MEGQVDTDLSYLAWSAFLCSVLWLPYVLERIQSQGLGNVLTYPENPPAPAAWAQRAQRAHLNLVENLPAFAALVIIAHLTDCSLSSSRFYNRREPHKNKANWLCSDPGEPCLPAPWYTCPPLGNRHRRPPQPGQHRRRFVKNCLRVVCAQVTI